MAWPTPPASHGNGPSLKEQKEKRPWERAETRREGALEGCGGLGLTAWSPGPEHHSWAWADMQRDTWVLVRRPWASWVGWGCCALLTCSHPFLPPNGRVGKICSTWKEKGFQADILPGSMLCLRQRQTFFECRRLHKLKPPGALTGVIVLT